MRLFLVLAVAAVFTVTAVNAAAWNNFDEAVLSEIASHLDMPSLLRLRQADKRAAKLYPVTPLSTYLAPFVDALEEVCPRTRFEQVVPVLKRVSGQSLRYDGVLALADAIASAEDAMLRLLRIPLGVIDGRVLTRFGSVRSLSPAVHAMLYRHYPDGAPAVAGDLARRARKIIKETDEFLGAHGASEWYADRNQFLYDSIMYGIFGALSPQVRLRNLASAYAHLKQVERESEMTRLGMRVVYDSEALVSYLHHSCDAPPFVILDNGHRRVLSYLETPNGGLELSAITFEPSAWPYGSCVRKPIPRVPFYKMTLHFDTNLDRMRNNVELQAPLPMHRMLTFLRRLTVFSVLFSMLMISVAPISRAITWGALLVAVGEWATVCFLHRSELDMRLDMVDATMRPIINRERREMKRYSGFSNDDDAV